MDNHRYKILIADSNQQSLQKSAMMLRHKDYEMHFATNMDSAMEKIDVVKFDLILIDSMLDGTEGYNLVEKLRKKESIKSIPIILSIEDNDAEYIERCFESGASDYITRPYIKIELVTRIRNYVKIHQIETELKKKKKEVIEIAIHDELTGIYNRRYLSMSLEREFQKAQRYGNELTCLLVDIDDFKVINEKYNEQLGDSILKDVAYIIETESRRSDLCGRYGVDEFMIIVPQNPEDAYKFAEKIKKIINNNNFYHKTLKEKINITVSTGIATYIDGMLTEEDLIHRAYAALRKSKHKGKDCITVFSN